MVEIDGALMEKRYVVVRSDGYVEGVVIWDGASEWVPCHDGDKVIPCGDAYVGPGFTMLEDGSFVAPEQI